MRGKCGWGKNGWLLNLTIKAAHKNYPASEIQYKRGKLQVWGTESSVL